MVIPTRPKAQGFGAVVGDEHYRLAISPEMPLRVFTKDSLAPRTDDRDSDENVLAIGHSFSRSDLTGGEGLDVFPRVHTTERQPRDNTRFWDSSNIVIERPDAGQPHVLRLARDTETFWTPGTAPTDMASGAGQMYVLVNDTVHRFADLTDTSADETDDINVTLIQIAADNAGAVAVLDTNGDIWYKAPAVSTYLKVYDSTTHGPMFDAKAIWLVKGRIIAYCDDTATAGDGVMLEIGPVITGTVGTPTLGASTYTTIDTFPSVMLDCVDAGHAIVASFTDGSIRSYVPQTDAAGTAPELTIRGRTPMPVGETPYRLAYNAGTLLVFTIDSDADHLRLYAGTVLDDRFDFVVGQLQLMRTWLSSVETYPAYTANAVSTRDAIYFWIGESSANYNLWKFDLVTQGLFRERGDTRVSRPLGTVIMEDRLTFVVGSDVIRENDNYVDEGYLITPNINFGLNTTINWTAFVIEAINVEGGAQVIYYRSTDEAAILDPNDSTWVEITTVNDSVQSGFEHNRINVQSNQLALKILLMNGSDGADSPEVPRFALRAIPEHRDWVAEIPINVSDYIDAPGRMPLRVGGLGNETVARALSQQGLSTVLTLYDPAITLVGVVDNVGIPFTYRSDRGSQGRALQMIFLGSRLTEETQVAAIGSDGLGIGTLGIATLGIGELEG